MEEPDRCYLRSRIAEWIAVNPGQRDNARPHRRSREYAPPWFVERAANCLPEILKAASSIMQPMYACSPRSEIPAS